MNIAHPPLRYRHLALRNWLIAVSGLASGIAVALFVN